MSNEITEHVSDTITEDTVGVARADFGVALIASANAPFGTRTKSYRGNDEVLVDYPSTSPEALAARAIFAQSPKPDRIKIGKLLGKPTQRYAVSLQGAPEVGAAYELRIRGQGVTDTTVSYTALANLDFLAADVTTGTDLIAEPAHGMLTGAGPFRLSTTGALPTGTGIAVDTNVFIIATTADSYKLATSKANALANTAIDITAAGSGTHTLLRAANDVIMAQLVAGASAVTGANYTAAQVTGAGDTDSMTLTGNVAGNWFAVEPVNLNKLKVLQTHAEPAITLATDLAAISKEDSDWYFLITLYNSDACVKAAALWAEGETRLYVADLCDTDIATTVASSGDGDTANDLKNLNLGRTAVAFHPSTADMLGAAWVGRVAPTTPGQATWKFKRLSTVRTVALDSDQRQHLRDKHANTYTLVAPNLPFTWEGQTADGDFIDATRGDDMARDDIRKSVLEVLAGNDIVFMDDSGGNQLGSAVEGALARAVTNGIYLNPVVTVPLVDALTVADRTNRLFGDILWATRRRGAVHKVTSAGAVSV